MRSPLKISRNDPGVAAAFWHLFLLYYRSADRPWNSAFFGVIRGGKERQRAQRRSQPKGFSPEVRGCPGSLPFLIPQDCCPQAQSNLPPDASPVEGSGERTTLHVVD